MWAASRTEPGARWFCFTVPAESANCAVGFAVPSPFWLPFEILGAYSPYRRAAPAGALNTADGYQSSRTVHSDPSQIKKAFLTRGLCALAISLLAEAPLDELGPAVTDGPKDGGIDIIYIYFDAKEAVLYLGQGKWHEDGHGSIELGDALKFIEGVRKVLDNDLDQLNERIKARKGDIERAVFDANAKFVVFFAHTGQESLSDEVSAAISSYVKAQNDTSELMFLRVLTQADLHKAVAAGVAGTPISVEVQIAGWGQMREPHFAVYGQVCAADVAVWMHSHGYRLFESNLRQFLGVAQ